MQLPPPDVLLSWPTPNYKDPKTRGHELEILTCIFFPIALLMIGLRTFTRLRITKAWGIDDILLLCAVLPTLAVAISTIYAVRVWGWDRHVWDVEVDKLENGLRLLVAVFCLFAITVSLYKMSILILTKRIMTSSTGILRHIATAGMVVVVLEAVIFCVVVINTCSPVSAYWTLSFKPQHCINERTHILIGGIINTFTDFLVFFLPLPTVIQLKMPFRQQLILGLLFGAGFAVCVAGTARIVYSWRATSTYDRTWEAYGLWICGSIELYVGLICAAIPGCKPFFTRYLPGLLGSSIGQSRGTMKNSTVTEGNGKLSQILSSHNGASRQSNLSFTEEGTDLQDLGKMENTITYKQSDLEQFLHATSELDQISQAPPPVKPSLQARPSSQQTTPVTWLETPSDSGEESSWEERSDRSSQELKKGVNGTTFDENQAAGKRRRSKTPRSKFSTVVGQETNETIGRAETTNDSTAA